MFDIQAIRKDFPILSTQVYNKPLVYFDNGATTQKPQIVIDTLTEYYSGYNSNVHRGVHLLSQKATDAEEAARATVQGFINAARPEEIIFTKGTTDSINLLANAYCKAHIRPGDEIIITQMEHHSNIVPWQLAAEERGGIIKVVPLQEDGSLDMNAYKALFSPRTRMVAFTWVSNTLGTVNPVAEMVQIAHEHGCHVMVDAAQAIQHLVVDVRSMDIDFLVFSGHKIYAPTGIGVLYGKYDLLAALPPYQGGGSMIKTVSLPTGTTYAELPHRFEAGTPNIAGIIGLGAALKYVADKGIEAIAAHEHKLLEYATQQLKQIPGMRIIGEASEKSATVSFLVDGIHPFDIGELLDKQGIAVRTGHHCCQPIMDKYCIPGTVRISFAMYNTQAEIDIMIDALKRAIAMLG